MECTFHNGNPFQSRVFSGLLRSYVILLICVLIVPAEPYVLRTRERVAGMQKYPQWKAGKVMCTGLHKAVPGDNNCYYPAYLSCLFSFILSSGNHLPFLMAALSGSHPVSRYPSRLIKSGYDMSVIMPRAWHNLNPLVNITLHGPDQE
jgi:hypothetical protein